MKNSLTVLYIALVSFLLTELSTGDSTDDNYEKCMGELGCFRLEPPFYDRVRRPIGLPEDRKEINTKFLLYTRRNFLFPKSFSNIQRNVKEISQTNFNPEALTVFLIAGFHSGSYKQISKQIAVHVILNLLDCNVFLLDWSGDGPEYKTAVANSRVVGAEVAEFIKRLQRIAGLQLELVYLVGDSLGAHIAGYAGKRLSKIWRISGLDPAGPNFNHEDPIVRLDRNDAEFVDVIHTNAAETSSEGYGINQSIGHFDFYANGGSQQPGCERKHGSKQSQISCNHMRAFDLYISSSLNTERPLMGVVCGSYEQFNQGRCGDCSDVKWSESSCRERRRCIPLGLLAGEYASLKRENESINLYLNTTDEEPYYVS